MLKVKIGSSTIPCEPGISLPLVRKSPIFFTDDGKIPGSYIFNTRFPATNELRKEFNQAHRIQRNGRATAELPYEISNGILRYAGNCIVTQADEDAYEIAFKIDNGDLATRLKDLTLKDLDFGGDLTIADTYSAAHDKIGYTRDINYYQQFSDEHIIDYDTIDIDLGNNFSNIDGTASHFIASQTADIKINISFLMTQPFAAVYPTLRIYKNDTLYESHSLGQAEFNIKTTIPVLNGDEIYMKIYAESQIAFDTWVIRYTIKNLSVQFYDTNIFNDTVETNQEQSDFAIFPVNNPQLLSNFPDDAFELDNLSLKTLYTEYFPTLNYYKDGQFPLFHSGTREGEDFFAANLLCPFVYMNTILNKIASEAGYTIVNSPFAVDGDFWGAVLFNAYCENTYTSGDTQLVPIKTTFNLRDHVPAISQSDFLKAVSKFTGYAMAVDNNLLTITFYKVAAAHIESENNPSLPFPGILLEPFKVQVKSEYKGIRFELKKPSSDQYISDRIKSIDPNLVYKGAVAHINNLPASGNEVGDYYKVNGTNSFYVWQYNEETYTLTWCFLTRDFPLVFEEGEEPFLAIESELAPVLSQLTEDTTVGAPTGRLWDIPVTWQPGILEGFPPSLASEYGFQILFYGQLYFDSLGQPYPHAMSNPGDYASFINYNARDIYDLQYKAFLQWIAYQAKPVTCKAIVTPAQLSRIDFSKIYRFNNLSFLIKEIRVNILHDGLSLAEMDIYTC